MGTDGVCLQTYLQHPGGHHPTHVGLDVLLHAFEVGALGKVALLDGEQVLQNAVIVEQVGVWHGPADRVHLAAQQLHGQPGARSLPCFLRTGKVGGFLEGGGERVPLTSFLWLNRGFSREKLWDRERGWGRGEERVGRWERRASGAANSACPPLQTCLALPCSLFSALRGSDANWLGS